MDNVANRCWNFPARLLLSIPYRDTTNPFKAYRRTTLNRVDRSSNGFEIFLEMPLKAMMIPSMTIEEIEASHKVKRKKAPKLSIAKDGYRYAQLLLTLCRRKRGNQERKSYQGAQFRLHSPAPCGSCWRLRVAISEPVSCTPPRRQTGVLPLVRQVWRSLAG